MGERLTAKKIQQERLAAKYEAKQKRLVVEKVQQERLAAKTAAEQERLCAEKAEQERLAAEKAEQEAKKTEAEEQVKRKLAARKSLICYGWWVLALVLLLLACAVETDHAGVYGHIEWYENIVGFGNHYWWKWHCLDM